MKSVWTITFIELLIFIYLISPTKTKNLFFKAATVKVTKVTKRYETKKRESKHYNNFHPGVSQIKIVCLRAATHQCFQLQVF